MLISRLKGRVVMCGRFSLSEEIGQLQQQLNFEFSDEIRPRYNIAPNQYVKGNVLSCNYNLILNPYKQGK